MSYKITTAKNYDFFEVASALQKSIRRGMENDSLYWSTELIVSGYSKYLWKRIFTMVAEDIGLAEPNLPQQIKSLHDMYEWGAKNKLRDNDLFIYQAILSLVRSQKSRLVDWCKNYALDNHWLVDKKIPDYALDKHTKRGKIMGRTIDHFFDHGAKLENHKPLENEQKYLDWCKTHWTAEMSKKIESAKKQYKIAQKPQKINDDAKQQKPQIGMNFFEH